MLTETQHLHKLYQQFQHDIATLTTQLADLSTEAKQVKRQLGTDGHLDLGTYTETLDTFASIEANNRQIDTLNTRAQTAATRLAHAKLLLPQAYFAKLQLDYGDDDPEAYHLGKVGYIDAQANDLVYDWRAPVADAYYANRTGATSYQANGRDIPVTVLARQQFVIDHDQLLQVVNTQSAIGDPLLLAVLAENRSGGLQEITATIQQEQNAIIRESTHQVVLVDGVAGSGKTSVLLQRVAYQLYRHRDTWTSADILILTPNTAFSRYIRGVLPALGEAEPLTSTYANLIQAVGTRLGLTVTNLADNHLATLDRLLQQPFLPTPAGLSPQAYAQTDSQDSFLNRMQHAWRWLTAMQQLPADVSHWLDWDALAAQWHLATLTTYDQLYLLIKITNYQQTTTAALFVDEAQDYDADTWLMLQALFTKAQLTIVGDHRQRLTGQAPDIAAYFTNQTIQPLQLTTSYRATGAITTYFAQFAGDWQSRIKAVQANGLTPQTVTTADLKSVLDQLPIQNGQSVGIITPNQASADTLATQFPIAHHLTAAGHQTVQPGLNLMALPVAKGLEFDHAIIVDWTNPYYLDTETGDHRRYVATSRGTKTLTLITDSGPID
ncbi:AAA family ATPase [Lactiplantibacillus dongliensis]|uniref:AAA family ATPase n=1 Tax=Lactiplantibacillus dongliensis TaxID=2559919 RepID=A0ABW1R934_9LACO|nr:AAA family ATPase [Lactiplantibacillus dongliensis]